jgi:hypothetical protein
VDPSVVTDMRARLTELLGEELALYDLGSDAQQKPIDRMIAPGRVLFSPSDAAKAYPELFNERAARRALDEATKAALPQDLCEATRHRMEQQGMRPATVTYRPQGRGQQTRQALLAAAALPDFRFWLEAALGSPLASFTVTQPAAAEPAPEPAAKTDPFADLVRVDIRNTDDMGSCAHSPSPKGRTRDASYLRALRRLETDIPESGDRAGKHARYGLTPRGLRPPEAQRHIHDLRVQPCPPVGYDSGPTFQTAARRKA